MEDDTPTEAVVVADKIDLEKSIDQNVSYHKKGIKEYYEGDSMMEIAEDEDMNTETLIRYLTRELYRDIDNLSGNIAIAKKNGELEKSSVISTKRSEIVVQAIKTIMAQKEFDATTSIDVESPSMRVVFQYFLEKCQESFTRAGMNSEISDTFFRNFNDICGNTWKKDLKRRIAEIKT